MKNLSKFQSEELKLNTFLQNFLASKKLKMQELEKLGQFSDEKRIDFDLLEDILKNRIELHKKGKQECDQIINIIGEYANSNF